MKCVWLLAALSAASVITGVGCGDPTTAGGTALNLDRPIDVAFACYGAMRQTGGRAKGETTDPVFATAQPPAACQALSPPLSTDTITPAPGQETISGQAAITPSWYAFILQSATGTVALTRWAPKAAESMIAGVSDGGGEFAVLDGDSLTPAKNAISVGEDPIAIATDKAGCFEVTANAGSCDLSELDINSALDDIQPLAGKAATPVKVDRVRVTNATATPTDALKGVILARPAAMVAESPITVVGNACPATATGRIYIAYPSCHLVAGVDAATGKIVAGITFDAAGTPSILSGAALDNVSCPDECANAAGVFANGPVTAGARPVALALQRDTRAATNRLAIGADNSASITVVDLDPTTSAPTAVFQVPLENTTGKLGVTAVSLSPQIAMGGNAADPQNPVRDDVSPGGQAQYVYAIATDGTVRVADVLTKHKECDTQVDARFVRGISDVSVLSCLPVGAPATPQRRSGARGPGIELPFGAVPTSVAIVKGRSAPKVSGTPAVTAPAAPTNLLGTFAIVTTSSGVVYVVNIDDDYAPDVFSTTDPVGTAPVLVMAHQLRDSFSSRGQGPLSDGMNLCKQTDPPPASGGVLGGGPRPLLAPSQTPPSGTIAADKVLPPAQVPVRRDDPGHRARLPRAAGDPRRGVPGSRQRVQRDLADDLGGAAVARQCQQRDRRAAGPVRPAGDRWDGHAPPRSVPAVLRARRRAVRCRGSARLQPRQRRLRLPGRLHVLRPPPERRRWGRRVHAQERGASAGGRVLRVPDHGAALHGRQQHARRAAAARAQARAPDHADRRLPR
jgi:hypothetical protein